MKNSHCSSMQHTWRTIWAPPHGCYTSKINLQKLENVFKALHFLNIVWQSSITLNQPWENKDCYSGVANFNCQSHKLFRIDNIKFFCFSHSTLKNSFEIYTPWYVMQCFPVFWLEAAIIRNRNASTHRHHPFNWPAFASFNMKSLWNIHPASRV